MTLDELDRALLHALHLDGRVPFNHVATVVGASPQTVARRYRRLRADGVLRVVGMTDPRRLGQVQWFVRLRCTPDAVLKVAGALARRADTSWVQLMSGGTEIFCITRGADAPDSLLLQELPKTPRVVSVSAHCLLRSFVGGPVGWHGRATALTEEQIAQLTLEDKEPSGEPVDLAGDDRLLALLQQDGRAAFADLAEALGTGEASVRRRVGQLRRAGVLYFDIDLDPTMLGMKAQAVLWMSVRPAQLRTVAEILARHPEVALVAATTGATNLLAKVLCRDVDSLYTYLADSVGGIDAVGHVETAPVIRTLKRAATQSCSRM
ncbi:Lrp/AsnC family transcriptional regulator [Actinocrispum wychmicini]|uniref:DNA-binding Lrp family transcriptional regulator n=1 Tax=Actinocrispum wychmicini TaxID=1213861 RepID=A0A4R2J789_9PSEU|nr:Lrp/AsnC family transcriptional regulator [Actinocrispum wychmicini]TCO52378.1 DNA-binding Lrp family transcriptional regulator [Actinocrispum wychmicini]